MGFVYRALRGMKSLVHLNWQQIWTYLVFDVLKRDALHYRGNFKKKKKKKKKVRQLLVFTNGC